MGMTCRQLSMSLHMKLQPQRKKNMQKAMKGIAVIATMQRRRHSSRRKRQQPMQ